MDLGAEASMHNLLMRLLGKVLRQPGIRYYTRRLPSPATLHLHLQILYIISASDAWRLPCAWPGPPYLEPKYAVGIGCLYPLALQTNVLQWRKRSIDHFRDSNGESG